MLFRWTTENGESGPLEEMKEQLKLTIQRTFNVTAELAERLQLELMQCVKRKNLVSDDETTFTLCKNWGSKVKASIFLYGLWCIRTIPGGKL